MADTISKRKRYESLKKRSFWFPENNELLANQRRLDWQVLAQRTVRSNCSKEQDHFDELYTHTNSLALNTFYEDCDQLLSWCHRQGLTKIADLGCGYGRLCALASYLFVQIDVLCIDINGDYIRRLKQSIPQNKMKNVFCSNIYLPWPEVINQAELYFIYLPTGKLLKRILTHLYSLNRNGFYLAAIESHGQLLAELDHDHPWLIPYEKFLLKGMRHQKYCHIYKCDRSLEKNTHPLMSGDEINLYSDKHRRWFDSFYKGEDIFALQNDGVIRFFLSDDLNPIRYVEKTLYLESPSQRCIYQSWEKLWVFGRNNSEWPMIFYYLQKIKSAQNIRKIIFIDGKFYFDNSEGKRFLVNKQHWQLSL